MKHFLVLMALATTGAAAQAPAPKPGFSSGPASRPCLSPIEAKELATFVLPGLVEGLASRCRGSLGRDAFLRTSANAALAQRLRRDGAPSWPVAKSAIEKLNGNRLPGLFGESFIKTVAEGAAADIVLRPFDRSDCGATNELVAGLAPLPSSNFSSVIAALIALGADSADENAPLRICTAPIAAR